MGSGPDSPHSAADAFATVAAFETAGAAAPAEPDATQLIPAAGMTLGPYELVSKLGEGGMGAVWKARQSRLDRFVAVKLLSSKLVGSESALARFHREMKLAGRVMHPNVVTAFDAGESAGVHYLAMEYVEGIDLQALSRQRGPFTPMQAAKAIRQAALGLAAAHNLGLVHRDIKPMNLLLSKSGQIKVLDLGLARLLEEADADAGQSGLTGAGQVMGTPDYMAPEQWADTHSVGPAADLYALGCTMFFLLTGKPPFSGETHPTAVRKMAGHSLEAPPDLAKVCPKAPPGLVEIYQKLMAKQPADRFGSAAELAVALLPFTTKAKPAADAETKPCVGKTEPEPDLAAFLASVAGTMVIGGTYKSPVREAATGSATPLAASQPGGTPTPQTLAAGNVPPKRPRKLLLGAGGFGAMALLGIVITITGKDGKETKIEVPDGATVRIDPADGGRQTPEPSRSASAQFAGTVNYAVNCPGVLSPASAIPLFAEHERLKGPVTIEAWVCPGEVAAGPVGYRNSLCSLRQDERRLELRIISKEKRPMWQAAANFADL